MTKCMSSRPPVQVSINPQEYIEKDCTCYLILSFLITWYIETPTSRRYILRTLLLKASADHGYTHNMIRCNDCQVASLMVETFNDNRLLYKAVDAVQEQETGDYFDNYAYFKQVDQLPDPIILNPFTQ